LYRGFLGEAECLSGRVAKCIDCEFPLEKPNNAVNPLRLTEYGNSAQTELSTAEG